MDNPSTPIEPNAGQTRQIPAQSRRPGSVTLMIAIVLIITTVNLIRLVLSVKDWSFLAAWPGVSPLYVLLTGLIWTLAGVPLLWGLWRAKNWAPRLMQAMALTYALYFWLDQVFLVDHPVSGAEGTKRALLPVNWKFAVGATVISLAYIAWALRRKKVLTYYGIDGSSEERGGEPHDEDG